MLKYEQVVPANVQDGAPLVVLLHGRGSDRFDLLQLAPMLAPDAVVTVHEPAPDEHVLGSILREGMQIMAGVFWDLGEAPPPISSELG